MTLMAAGAVPVKLATITSARRPLAMRSWAAIGDSVPVLLQCVIVADVVFPLLVGQMARVKLISTSPAVNRSSCR